jgi:hypothetical protein
MSNNESSQNGGKSTGPRTPEGKAISKLNATKHGIFSGVVILKGESQQDYEALLDGLQQACRPVGSLETVLVDKMATILWRHKRLLLAEVGEIGQNWLRVDLVALPESSDVTHTHRWITTSLSQAAGTGLLDQGGDITTLTSCKEILTELRDALRQRGFEEDNDRKVLKLIYGEGELSDLSRTALWFEYNNWLAKSKAALAQPNAENQPSVEDCKGQMVQAINAEIDRLGKTIEKIKAAEIEKRALARLCGSIPTAAAMERILRYQASLERAFDRVLAQLERLQRIRLGQPVLPQVQVDITH